LFEHSLYNGNPRFWGYITSSAAPLGALEELLGQLQKSGEAFPSNALVGGKYLLRVCIVNFRTSLEDIETVPVWILKS
jgi:hypothetical protein